MTSLPPHVAMYKRKMVRGIFLIGR